MNSRARGYSLVELLVVAVLLAVIMGAVYKTLTVQQRSNRQINVVTNSQQASRMAIQYLASELREIGSGAGDVLMASPDSIRVQVLRKAGFVCGISAGGGFDVFTLGDPLTRGDTVAVNGNNGNDDTSDDVMVQAVVTGVAATSPPGTCLPLSGEPWASMGYQARTITLNRLPGSPLLSTINTGGGIRSYRTTTYGIYSVNGQWMLGRRQSPPDTVVALIGPLAPPQTGLVLRYFDRQNVVIPNGLLPWHLGDIGRIRVTVVAQRRGAVSPSGIYSDTLTTNISLRGN